MKNVHKAISQPSEYSPPRFVGCKDTERMTVGAVSYVAVWEEGEPQGL